MNRSMKQGAIFLQELKHRPWTADYKPPGMEIYELKSLSRVVSTSKLAPDWLHNSEKPMKRQVRKLTPTLDSDYNS